MQIQYTATGSLTLRMAKTQQKTQLEELIPQLSFCLCQSEMSDNQGFIAVFRSTGEMVILCDLAVEQLSVNFALGIQFKSEITQSQTSIRLLHYYNITLLQLQKQNGSKYQQECKAVRAFLIRGGVQDEA